MALNDLTGQNIQDTFQKVVQTEGTNLADGTGSLLPLSFDGNTIISSGNISSSGIIYTDTLSEGNSTAGLTLTGNITSSGNISSSGIIYTNTLSEGNSLTGLTLTGNITSSGNISASGDVSATNFLIKPGGAVRPSTNNQEINFRSAHHGSADWMTLSQDEFQFKFDGRACVLFTKTATATGTISFNQSNDDWDFKVQYGGGGGEAILTDGEMHFTRMGGPVVITRSGSVLRPPQTTNHAAVEDVDSALQLSGSLYIDGHVTASGTSTLTGGVVLGSETIASGDISPIIPITFITIDATKAYALADGTTAGTIKYLSVKTVANTPAGTLTPNATAGAWATAAFSVVGQTLTLLWDGAGWSITGRGSGAAAAKGVVAELPVIAT